MQALDTSRMRSVELLERRNPVEAFYVKSLMQAAKDATTNDGPYKAFTPWGDPTPEALAARAWLEFHFPTRYFPLDRYGVTADYCLHIAEDLIREFMRMEPEQFRQYLLGEVEAAWHIARMRLTAEERERAFAEWVAAERAVRDKRHARQHNVTPSRWQQRFPFDQRPITELPLFAPAETAVSL